MKNILLTFILAGILVFGITSAPFAVFADPGHTHNDDDDHDGGYQNSVNHVWTGKGTPNKNLGKLNDLYIDEASSGHTVYQKTTKYVWTPIGPYLGGSGTGSTGPTGEIGRAHV